MKRGLKHLKYSTHSVLLFPLRITAPMKRGLKLVHQLFQSRAFKITENHRPDEEGIETNP
jgi:hypothetical protein